jgi:hypothetical protein
MARKEAKIGAATFYINTFAPRDQLRIFGDLQKELLPSLGTLLAAATGNPAGEGSGDEERAIMDALRSFSGSLDGRALDAWCDRLIDSERVTFERPGKDPRKLTKAHMDDAFEDFAEILELLFHIIQLNFAGPLGRWLGLFGSGQGQSLAGLLGGSIQTSSASS